MFLHSSMFCSTISPFVKISKRKFSMEEDAIIVDMVCKFGIHYWKQIAKEIGRTPRQCRERWKHYLCPGIDSSPWTPEEDAIIEKKYSKFGPKWSLIREFLPGRTDVNIKNRHALLLRREQRMSGKKVQTQKQSAKSPNKIPEETKSNDRKSDFFKILQDLEQTISSIDPFSMTFDDFNDIINDPFHYTDSQ